MNAAAPTIPPELLAQLRDIHAPPPPPWWPPAPGWWLLVALVLAGLAWRRRARRLPPAVRRNAALPAAYAELEALLARHRRQADAARLLADLSTLVRRVAVECHGRPRTAGLTGEAWLAFLDQTGGGREFRQGVGRLLATLPYQPAPREVDEALIRLVRRWLQQQENRSQAP